MSRLGPRCIYCKHYNRKRPGTCAAFPRDIPAKFTLGEAEHLTPCEGDHGIQFELDRIFLPMLSDDTKSVLKILTADPLKN